MLLLLLAIALGSICCCSILGLLGPGLPRRHHRACRRRRQASGRRRRRQAPVPVVVSQPASRQASLRHRPTATTDQPGPIHHQGPRARVVVSTTGSAAAQHQNRPTFVICHQPSSACRAIDPGRRQVVVVQVVTVIPSSSPITHNLIDRRCHFSIRAGSEQAIGSSRRRQPSDPDQIPINLDLAQAPGHRHIIIHHHPGSGHHRSRRRVEQQTNQAAGRALGPGRQAVQTSRQRPPFVI